MIGVGKSKHKRTLKGESGDVASENQKIKKTIEGKGSVLVDDRTREARPKKIKTSNL